MEYNRRPVHVIRDTSRFSVNVVVVAVAVAVVVKEAVVAVVLVLVEVIVVVVVAVAVAKVVAEISSQHEILADKKRKANEMQLLLLLLR